MTGDVERDLERAGYSVIMSAGEVCRALRCSQTTLWRMRSAGKLPTMRRGGNGPLCFRRSDVAKALAPRKRS